MVEYSSRVVVKGVFNENCSKNTVLLVPERGPELNNPAYGPLQTF